MVLAMPLVIHAIPRERESYSLLRRIQEISDTLFSDVKKEDLLVDEVYIKLARDGWSQDEIRRVMNNYVRKNRSSVRGSLEYGRYAKQWLPSASYTPGGDSMYQFIDTTYNENIMHSVRSRIGADFDAYYRAEPYTPEERLNGRRQPGIFRSVEFKPSSGRIHWIHVHPENDDSLMVIPDGGGIFRTHDLGKSWECITDRIPVREHRNTATHSAIPVDPDDWNHVYAFMSNGNPVYETRDGGENWKRVEGATHKNFKRGYCFRDKAGNLKFIGAVQTGASSYWSSPLYISEDTCKTWTQVIVPEELRDIHPVHGGKGTWFQQVEFDPENRDMIYLPTSRSIFYFDDGATSYTENGQKVYRIKKMPLRVHDQNGTVLRSDTTVFPLPATSQGFLNVNPNNPKQMWFAAGIRNGNQTALYYSEDSGRNWVTLQEPMSNIGSGRVFGNEAPWGWLGGFGVNFTDPSWIYGCSMSSAISSDGGHSFSEYAWGHRMKALYEDGTYYYASNSRHNADNHCIVSHKSGRVFRGSDGGMLMKDKQINDHQWTNIGSNMGQMLFYCIKTNEFGDQLMMGNTQDIDVQTYRYGRWGSYRGYEGSTGFTNPYSNTCYYPSGGGGIEEANFTSWVPGYSKADVCTGSWYLRRSDGTPTFFRIDDVGRSMYDISSALNKQVRSFSLCRDKGHATVFILCNDKTVYSSVDNGNTFTAVTPTTGSAITTDPNNSDIVYLGERGNVWIYDIKKGTRTRVGEGLPAIDCHRLFFHEGSGDLYFGNTQTGIFLKEKNAEVWRLWMKGYNTTKFNDMIINYTTQEMVVSDYGRGVFVADLENPADRFFSDGFALKEHSHIGERYTLGIDTQWTIPLYYYYEWSVNGVKQDNPYQYLTASLKKGDRVQLKLTLRESPDVTTLSKEFVVKETEAVPLQSKTGNALYSKQKGMVDLGYVDYFFNDFTIDLWVNPQSDGVLLCNRQKEYERGAKGWYLYLEGGSIRFKYAPANMFSLPTYEPTFTQQTEISGGTLEMGGWSHIAVTQERSGNLRMYVNGILKAEGARILPRHTLNNAMNLMLFADGYEYAPIEASVDELRIWKQALTPEEIRRIMFSHQTNNPNQLVFYQSFNADSLQNAQETFSNITPRIRKRADVSFQTMPVPLGAVHAVVQEISQEPLFVSGNQELMRIRPDAPTFAATTGVYVYERNRMTDTPSNLDEAYYEVYSKGYQLHCFESTTGNDTVTLDFFTENSIKGRECRIYVSENEASKKYWRFYKPLETSDEEGVLRATGVSLSDLQGKSMLIVTLKPAIEVSIPQLSASGELKIYDAQQNIVNVHARLTGNMQEPFTAYAFKANHPMAAIMDEFSFTKGEAEGRFRIDTDSLGSFGTKRELSLLGDDNRMIPLPFEIINRITPEEAGSGIQLIRGGLTLGNPGIYQPIHQSNTVSFMGWIRIDSAAMLSGLRPLLMFRGNGVATGIHLDNGQMRCHWNEEGWSWSASTTHKVTSEHLGRWLHFALVARPDGMDYYLNGAKYTIARTINKTRISSALMLGQNFAGDKWFCGAFDHVAVWNRSLTQEEVFHFMHNRVPENDPKLVAYANMDLFDTDDNVLEVISGTASTTYGTVLTNHRSTVPFKATDGWTNGCPETPVLVSDATGEAPQAALKSFSGYPYNYVTPQRTSLRPLKKTYYTFTPHGRVVTNAGDSVFITVHDEAILANDPLTLALRPLGSEKAFADFTQAVPAKEGEVRFQVPAALLTNAAEMLVMIDNVTGERPVKGELLLAGDDNGIRRLRFGKGEDQFRVHLRMNSYNGNEVVVLSAKEAEYVSLKSDTLLLSQQQEAFFTIRINKERLHKKGWNPVTLQVSGADVSPLELEVGLMPQVRLRLKNGIDDHHFTATTPISTLEIETELIEGILEEEVRLKTVSDMNSLLNTGNGTLLSDRTVDYDLKYFSSPWGEKYAGWNLIGNPYLTNINLTKEQNIIFDPEKVSKFLYAYNYHTDTYETYDMTQFDAEKQVVPFSAFFVQALNDEAKLTITPVAKETKLNRRTFSHFDVTERFLIRLALHTEGSLSDKTEVVMEPGNTAEYVLNEDAVKKWGLRKTSNHLYTRAGKELLSINALPVESMDIPVDLLVQKNGEFSFHIEDMAGFENGSILLTDTHTGLQWEPNATSPYTFRVPEAGSLEGRFVLRVTHGVTDIRPTHVYPVMVEDRYCIIGNLQGDARIQIFDVQGRICNDETVHTEEHRVRLNPGVFLVKIRENKKEFVSKIIVR